MQEFASRSEMRKHLDTILNFTYTTDDPFRAKAEEIMRNAYEDASEEEWNDMAERFAKSFPDGVDELGGGATSPRPLPLGDHAENAVGKEETGQAGQSVGLRPRGNDVQGSSRTHNASGARAAGPLERSTRTEG